MGQIFVRFAILVGGIRSIHDERLHRAQFDFHIREFFLHLGNAREQTPLHHVRRGVLRGVVERSARQAERRRAHKNAAKLVLALQHRIEAPLSLNLPFGRQAHVVEFNCRGREHLLTDRIERVGRDAGTRERHEP